MPTRCRGDGDDQVAALERPRCDVERPLREFELGRELCSADGAWVAGRDHIKRCLLARSELISVWELGMLVRRGRLSLDRGVARWVRQALAHERVDILRPGADVALAAALLDDSFPGDPADRLIFAAARHADAPLVSRDARIARFEPARVVW